MFFTSYVTVEPELAGGRNVTAETVPLADNIHNALGLCCANANIFADISCIVNIQPFLVTEYGKEQIVSTNAPVTETG